VAFAVLMSAAGEGVHGKDVADLPTASLRRTDPLRASIEQLSQQYVALPTLAKVSLVVGLAGFVLFANIQSACLTRMLYGVLNLRPSFQNLPRALQL
jgi:hypothetical protein